MRTTVTLDDDVVKTVRDEMNTGNGKTFKEAVNDLIRLGKYHKVEVEKSRRKPFKVRASDLGHYPLINYDKTNQLLAMLDDEEYLRKRDKVSKDK